MPGYEILGRCCLTCPLVSFFFFTSCCSFGNPLPAESLTNSVLKFVGSQRCRTRSVFPHSPDRLLEDDRTVNLSESEPPLVSTKKYILSEDTQVWFRLTIDLYPLCFHEEDSGHFRTQGAVWETSLLRVKFRFKSLVVEAERHWNDVKCYLNSRSKAFRCTPVLGRQINILLTGGK